SSIQLSFYQHQPGKTHINIIAANGKVVKTVAANNNSGRSSMITDISDLSSASYIIQIKTPGNIFYSRFIKQ
ncbi:MAG: T9SS type A sorting domain-containing protein, partial [Chitinophagaceae bacterium]|nr:T9SS type A sorting domain-containing protein [Chitinophagaceae bacterium]